MCYTMHFSNSLDEQSEKMIPVLVVWVYFWDFDSPCVFFQSECKVAKFRDYEEKLIVSAWYNKVS